MGYEVIYHYHERLEEGGYKKDETKTLKRKVGDAYEEVSLDKLASAVMAQLARRDIWVTNVEIFEYTKKEITFRETKGGIVIKNKKFSMDGDNITMQDIETAVSTPNAIAIVSQPQSKNGHPHNQLVPANPATRPSKIKRMVVFMPATPGDIQEIRKQGYAFTAEKKYPVYSESPHPRQVCVTMLRTVDDNGKDANVGDVCFVPANTTLIADKELGFSQVNKNMVSDEKLVWSGVIDQMVDIRKGKK